MTVISICIPTAKRPSMIKRLLANLLCQSRLPDEIIIVDGSTGDDTKMITENFADISPQATIKYIKSNLGLTHQRNVGIDNTKGDYIFMLDDDILLDSDCIQKLEKFVETETGSMFGGVSAYIKNSGGKQFFKFQKLYAKLGIYERLIPGVWLYVGEFIEISFLQPFSGIYETEFLPGGVTMWKREVFSEFRPDEKFLFGGEDKHFSLRVKKKWKLGVLGDAHLMHEHVGGGVRKPRLEQSFISMRNKAIIMNECTPYEVGLINYFIRYLSFLTYNIIELVRKSITALALVEHQNFQALIGEWAALVLNVIFPPIRKRNG